MSDLRNPLWKGVTAYIKANALALVVIAALMINFAGLVKIGNTNSYNVNQTNNNFKAQREEIELLKQSQEELQSSIDSVRATHPWRNPRQWNRRGVCKEGTFLGFILYTPVDTNITITLRNCLLDYKGPVAKINSLRRNWGNHSDHGKGKAVDLCFCPDVIDYLVSEEGKAWMAAHGITFYIEGKPGSKKVKNYLRDGYREYVFFNPKATGDHIHLEV